MSTREIVKYCQEKVNNPNFKLIKAWTLRYYCRRPIRVGERAIEFVGFKDETIGYICMECYPRNDDESMDKD